MKSILYITWLLLIFTLPISSNAQENEQEDLVIELPIKIDEYSNELYIDEDQQYKIKLNKKRVKFLIVEDIKTAKSPNPEIRKILKQPDNFPFMPDIKDTMIAFINDQNISKAYKLMIIIGLDNNNETRYFYKSLDSNNINSNYNNFIFFTNEQYKPLEIKYNDKPLEFILLNPFAKDNFQKPIKFKQNSNFHNLQIILTLGIHQGESSLSYEPDTAQNISSIYYEAKIINGFALKAQVYYYIKKFLVGFFLRYENLNYQNNTRIISSLSSGGRVNLNYTSNGNWPEQILHTGISASYDFLLFDNLIISPTIDAGYYFYTGNPKSFDTYQNGDIKKNFKMRYSINTGALLKFPYNDKIWFTTGVNYQYNHFDASSYFIDIKTDTYSSRQEIFRLEFGICYQM